MVDLYNVTVRQIDSKVKAVLSVLCRAVHPSYGRVKQNVDGCLFVWTDGGRFFLNSYLSRSPVCTTAQSALHIMLRGIRVYFMSINATFAIAARTRKVSRWPCKCPMTGNILILHKPLVEGSKK